jgi:hypothetical protein
MDSVHEAIQHAWSSIFNDIIVTYLLLRAPTGQFLVEITIPSISDDAYTLYAVQHPTSPLTFQSSDDKLSTSLISYM